MNKNIIVPVLLVVVAASISFYYSEGYATNQRVEILCNDYALDIDNLAMIRNRLYLTGKTQEGDFLTKEIKEYTNIHKEHCETYE